jgi:hypothetical protein
VNCNPPPYKKIKIHCTSGDVIRDDLISDLVIAILEDGSKISAYYHFYHNWMIKGDVIGNFKYGYIQLDKDVVSWLRIS